MKTNNIRKVHKKRNYLESEQQQLFFKMLSLKYSTIRPYVFSIPNGSRRTALQGRRLVLEGLTSGLPDVQLCQAVGKWHGLFLEFKTKNGRLTKNQSDYYHRLIAAGYLVYIVRSATEALKKVEDYLKDKVSI